MGTFYSRFKNKKVLSDKEDKQFPCIMIHTRFTNSQLPKFLKHFVDVKYCDLEK